MWGGLLPVDLLSKKLGRLKGRKENLEGRKNGKNTGR